VLPSKVDLFNIHNKILEAQLAQQANSSSTPPSILPSKLYPNMREQFSAMILRGGKKFRGW